MSPELSISAVIVTWNRRDSLRRLLRSLLDQSPPPHQIIVVDNASSDNTGEMIREEFADFALYLPLSENHGACYGRNEGIAKATGDLLLFLDDDVTLEAGCLENMRRVFERQTEIAALEARILSPDAISVGPVLAELTCCPHPVECAWMVRASALEKRPFPAHFNRQHEGPWVALSLYEKGYECAGCPDAAVVHHHAAGGQREKIQFFFARNSFLTSYQRMPFAIMPPIALYKAFRTLLNVRSMGSLSAWAGGIGDALRMIRRGDAPRQPISMRGALRYFRAVAHQRRPYTF